MTELTLSTPSILFSAISLILLAYTNRFLSYAQLVRTLKADYDKNPSTITHLQLANLRRRLYMARSMQLLGVSSLLLCVVCTFLIYIGLQMIAVYTFGVALVLLTISLGISIRELLISVRALELHLDSFERMKTLTATSGREGNIETPRRRKGTSEEHRPASVPTDQSLRTKKPAKGKTKKEESNKRVEAKAASSTSSSAAATTAVAATSRTTAATTTGSTAPAAPKGSGVVESSGTSGTSATSKSRRKKASATAATAATAASSTSATEEAPTPSPTKRQSKGGSDKQSSTSLQKQAPKSKAVVGETDDAVRVTATRSKTTLPIASTEAPEGKESSDTATRAADKSEGTSSSQRTQQGRRRGGRSRTRSTSETATAPGTGNAIQERSLPTAENINAEDIKG